MKKREISFKRKGRDRSILDGCTWARDKSGCHAEFILLLFYNGFLSQTLSTRCNSTQFPDSACIPNKTESGSQNISLIHSCKSIFKVEIFNFFFSLTIEKDSPIGLAQIFQTDPRWSYVIVKIMEITWHESPNSTQICYNIDRIIIAEWL